MSTWTETIDRRRETYLLLELGLVEGEVVVEDLKLGVLRAVLVEEKLREERHVLRVPDIVLVAQAEREDADDNTGVERKLGRQRREKRTDSASARANVVPIERNGEESKTLVTGSATEDAGDPWRVTSGQANDGDTGERSGWWSAQSTSRRF